ncbi:MAG: WD40 repeat domain-containing protein [Microscillaceae bacterium]|nr:WD40 repeat domain-containing protein [Microscillaceae bacterium]
MTKVEVHKKASLAGHTDCIYTLCPSPNDQFFFSSGGDGIVARWDLANPEIGDLIVRVPNSVYALYCLQAQKQLLVGQNFEGLHLIDLENKQEIRSVKLTDAAIFDIQCYGSDIFVACGDGVVIVVDYETFALRKHLKASDKSARCLSINPIEREFAVGYSDHSIKIFGLQDLDLHQSLQAHKNSVFALRYTPDGQYLLSGSRDAHLKVWEVEKKYALYESIVAHLYAINHLDFSPDGNYMATCSMDKSVKVWDIKTWQLIKVIDKARHAGHGTSVNKLLWSAYENLLISGSDDRLISVWDLTFL